MSDEKVVSLRELVIKYNAGNRAKKIAENTVAALRQSILNAAPKEDIEKKVSMDVGHLIVSVKRDQTKSVGYDVEKYIEILESKNLNKSEYLKYTPSIDLDKLAVLVETEVISEEELLSLELKSKPYDILKVTEYDEFGKVVKAE